jgi:hypothetical protein
MAQLKKGTFDSEEKNRWPLRRYKAGRRQDRGRIHGHVVARTRRHFIEARHAELRDEKKETRCRRVVGDRAAG